MRLSPKTALAILFLLMLSVWTLLAVEVALGQVDAVTVAMAVAFSLLLLAWPFLNGLRLTGSGPTRLVTCRECQAVVNRAYNFGFCIHCGAFAVNPKVRPVAQRA